MPIGGVSNTMEENASAPPIKQSTICNVRSVSQGSWMRRWKMCWRRFIVRAFVRLRQSYAGSVCQKAARSLRGLEPSLATSQSCAISVQICSSQRVNRVRSKSTNVDPRSIAQFSCPNLSETMCLARAMVVTKTESTAAARVRSRAQRLMPGQFLGPVEAHD